MLLLRARRSAPAVAAPHVTEREPRASLRVPPLMVARIMMIARRRHEARHITAQH